MPQAGSSSGSLSGANNAQSMYETYIRAWLANANQEYGSLMSQNLLSTMADMMISFSQTFCGRLGIACDSFFFSPERVAMEIFSMDRAKLEQMAIAAVGATRDSMNMNTVNSQALINQSKGLYDKIANMSVEERRNFIREQLQKGKSRPYCLDYYGNFDESCAF